MIDFLTEIYGDGGTRQLVRYETAVTQFTRLYGAGEIFFFRAPGRVNLIGGHTDYNHGYVMPIALDKDVVVLARGREDGRIRLHNIEPEFAPLDFEISENIPAEPMGDWGNYAKGPVQGMARKLKRPLHLPEGKPLRLRGDKPLHGFDGLIVAQAPFGVPRGAGLSSSSALIVAVAVTLAHFNEWQPDETTLAQLCADAELYVGTRGGIMDQFISVMGRKDRALFLDCRMGENGRYHTEHIPLPSKYSLLIVNSGVKHSNTGGGYNQRVAACRAGVGLLQAHYPDITHLRDVEDVAWEELSLLLPDQITVAELATLSVDLGDIPRITFDVMLKVRARCRHVWAENWRVRQAAKALLAGDVTQLGRLMLEAHVSARDDYEVSCVELEVLVKLLNGMSGVAATRLTGSGWGGCVVALVEDAAVDLVTEQIQTGYKTETGIHPDLFTCQSSYGAGYVGRISV